MFPCMIHEFDNPNFNELKNELIEYSYDERKKDPIGVKFSNRDGWQSNPFKVTDKNNILHSFLYIIHLFHLNIQDLKKILFFSY